MNPTPSIFELMNRLLEPFRSITRWIESKRRDREVIEAEAHALLAARSRTGALWLLHERSIAARGDKRELKRIAAIRQQVFRLTPPKADTATRMLYGDD